MLSKVTCGPHSSELAWESLERPVTLSSPRLGPHSGQKCTEPGTRWPGGGPSPWRPRRGSRQQASPPRPEPWGLPGSPQGTPRNRLFGLGGLLPRGASVLGWAKNSRGDGRAGTAAGGPAGRGQRGRGQQPRPGTAVNGAGAPTLVPGGRPAEAQLTRYFFPCLTKYGQGAQPEGAPWPGRVFGMLGRVYKDCKGEAGS